jgi:hypothetical protein
MPAGSRHGADRPERLASVRHPHGSRRVQDAYGVPDVLLALGKKSNTSIEHGSGVCIRGSETSKGRVFTPGGTILLTAPFQVNAY